MPVQLTILIAEDSPVDRMLLSAIVARQGHRVVTAADGQQAVVLFEQQRPQLVLMDALMPVMDGLQAAQRIKQLAGDELVPILFLTSLSEHQALVRCLEAGGDDFIAKPYNPVILEAKIQAMERLRRLHATVREQRDLIARRNRQLLDEYDAAKTIFDKVAHAGCLDAPNIRYRQSPLALFNGDLLLAAQAPTGQLLVLLGDFTGHGLPAAIGAMPLAETFYGMAAKGYTASEILRELNSKLKQILPVQMFCCATLLDIDPLRGTLRVWNGGLPDGYLLRADGSRTALRSGHLPLGILPAATFDATFEHLALDRGDRLLLLSDGLVESRNAADELFGEQRLLQLLDGNRDPARLFDEIEQALLAFHGQMHDDLSLVEVQVDGLGTSLPAAHGAPAPSRPMDWTARFELRAESLRGGNPLPQLLQLLLRIDPLRARVGAIYTVLCELYANALEHGVLGLDSAIKCDADGFQRYYELRRQRLQALHAGHVRLDFAIRADAGGGCLRLTVSDSGEGFAVAAALAVAGCEQSLSGRGLQLVRQLSDRFDWQDDGRSLAVEFAWVTHA